MRIRIQRINLMRIPIRIQRINFDPDFYLMRMRIQVTIMMRVLVDPDSGSTILFNTGSAYFRSSWRPEVKTRNTSQYRKCVYFRSSWRSVVKTRNTVQYRKCVFQIVLESGSDDSQPDLILPSGEIN